MWLGLQRELYSVGLRSASKEVKMFYIGQIFESSYPLEAAEFCMNNGTKIVEKPNGTFQIVEVEADLTVRRNELQSLLNETDWYVVRQAETGKEIPSEVLENRKAWRLELSDLK